MSKTLWQSSVQRTVCVLEEPEVAVAATLTAGAGPWTRRPIQEVHQGRPDRPRLPTKLASLAVCILLSSTTHTLLYTRHPPFSLFFFILFDPFSLFGSFLPLLLSSARCCQRTDMPLLEARVKSVLSGDTLILTHVTNRSQERTLSLAYVSAPRLRREDDEVSFLSVSFLLFFVLFLFFCVGSAVGSGLGGLYYAPRYSDSSANAMSFI